MGVFFLLSMICGLAFIIRLHFSSLDEFFLGVKDLVVLGVRASKESPVKTTLLVLWCVFFLLFLFTD